MIIEGGNSRRQEWVGTGIDRVAQHRVLLELAKQQVPPSYHHGGHAVGVPRAEADSARARFSELGPLVVAAGNVFDWDMHYAKLPDAAGNYIITSRNPFRTQVFVRCESVVPDDKGAPKDYTVTMNEKVLEPEQAERFALRYKEVLDLVVAKTEELTNQSKAEEKSNF